MDNFEELSNDELRLRLLEYGYQNMPVTQTTRKLYIKKLRNHLGNEKDKLRRETIHVTKYSSDEDAEELPAAKKESTTKRRATLGVSQLPKPVPIIASSKTEVVLEPPKSRKSGRLTPLEKPKTQVNASNGASKPDIDVALNDSDDEILLTLVNDDTTKKSSASTSRGKSKSQSPALGKTTYIKTVVEKREKVVPAAIIETTEEDEEQYEDDNIILVDDEEEEDNIDRYVAPTTYTDRYVAATSYTDKYNALRRSYLASKTPEVSSSVSRRQTVTSSAIPATDYSYKYSNSNDIISPRSTTAGYSRPSLSTSYNPVTTSDTYRSRYDTSEYNDSPYLSKFVSRLSQVRAEPLGGGHETQTRSSHNVGLYETRPQSQQPRTVQKPESIWDSFIVVLDGLERKYHLKRNIAIAFVLLIVLFLIVVFYF